jgi:transcriptional repressor NrdR
VIKRNGYRESFDRSKLLRGIVRACEKTGVGATKIEALVDDIEAQLQQAVMREVSSSEIGEIVLAQLAQLNEVAYVRFASVYRKFQGIRDFIETLNHLQSQQDSPETLTQPPQTNSAVLDVLPSDDDLTLKTRSSLPS